MSEHRMMKSRFTLTKWSSVLMIVAMLCNIMGGMKLFCAKEKSGSGETVAHPLVVGALNDDQIVATQTIPDLLQVVQYDGQPPRCKCKKAKPCSAIFRVLITSNPIQRFNEYQRQAWSERTHTMDAHETKILLKLRGDPLVGDRFEMDVCDPTEDILMQTSVLLI